MQRPRTVNILRLCAVSSICTIQSLTAFHLTSPLLQQKPSCLSTATTFAPHPSYPNLNLHTIHRAVSVETTDTSSSPPPIKSLTERAFQFLEHKNGAGRNKGTAGLSPLFAMCHPTLSTLDIYGLIGMEEVQSGLTDFFEKRPGLYHEATAEPTVMVVKGEGGGIVQYPFFKTWEKDDEKGGMTVKRWNSVDEKEGRDKVERLEFDEEGWLVKVSVVGRNDTSSW